MHAHIVVGLAFGDEGKGSWVDHLARRHAIKTVVRFNGGAQALHHVSTPRGGIHGFSQFGSHSFVPGAKTLLSRFMLIEPLMLFAEAAQLQKQGVADPIRTLIVSDEAPIIPYMNVLLNRIMEASRGNARHGSCGLGIGLTQRDVAELGADALRAADIKVGGTTLRTKLQFLYERTLTETAKWENERTAEHMNELKALDLTQYQTSLEHFAQQVRIVPETAWLSVLRRQPVIFEGAQGALLDEFQGTFPHCTRSVTTPKNALTLLAEAGFDGDVTRHGLLRAYGTRHGAGPFVTEAPIEVSGCDNVTGQWQGTFRHGWFDLVAARSALQFADVDHVVLTNLDRLDGLSSLKVAVAYRCIEDRFYDQATATVRKVDTYEESKKRTEALFATKPVYQELPAWTGGEDSNHEAYVKFIEQKIGKPIAALSRRKDHHKIYRH